MRRHMPAFPARPFSAFPARPLSAFAARPFSAFTRPFYPRRRCVPHTYTEVSKTERIHITVHNALEQMRAVDSPIERYLYIRSLRQDAPEVFYALLYKHVEEVLPYVYTPTVGEACQKYHQLPIRL